MANEMTKTQVLDTLHAERSRWEALLAEVGTARMTEQLGTNRWSVKDIMAHVTWHEQQTAAVLSAPTVNPGRDWLWELSEDKRNAILFTEYRGRPLADVRADAQQGFTHLVGAVEALSEADVRDPLRFPGTPPTWQPWSLIAGHSYEHYRQHTADIRAWLDTQTPPSRDPAAGVANWEGEGGHI